MNKVLLQEAIKLNNERKRRNRRRRLMQVLSVFVVFCTTYSLILPALTLEREPVCGYETHAHAEACYTEQTLRTLQCPPIEAEDIVHKHSDLCYREDGSLLCGLEEKEEHAHEDSCYTRTELICPEAHEHGDACYAPCEPKRSCDKEELSLHSHEADCWRISEDPEIEPELICTVPVVVEHVHADSCAVEEASTLLTCTVEEHSHGDRCYPIAEQADAPLEQPAVSEQPDVSQWGKVICGRDIHSHGDGCWQYGDDPNVPPVLTCTLMEHSHSAVCFPDGVLPVTPTPAPTAEPTPTPTPTPEVTQAPEATTAPVGTVAPDGPQTPTPAPTPAPTEAPPETEVGELVEAAWEVTETAETENYLVTVTYHAPTELPRGAQLQVTEYPKDSPIFLRRCAEAGYALEWLLNIGFFLNGEELELDGTFNVVVTSKTGAITGTDITHFADTGAQRISGETEGDAAVGFASDGFSDFGGGIALAAEEVDRSNQVRTDLPHAVTTGDVNINALRFYNLREGDGGVAPLAGCVFEIRDANGNLYATVVSGDNPEVLLPEGIPGGTYTITEVSVPDGYMRDERFQRTFVVDGTKFQGNNNIGTFINHDLGELVNNKTAEVEDYNNRIYQIMLDAESHMQMFAMDPIDVIFVVDQSNSMLFPSGLTETGLSVTLNKNGTNNVRNMNNLLNYGLDPDEVYYIISDPNGTSTVWALYQNNGVWVYQDASYFAKAKHNNGSGYQQDGELATFPGDRSYADQRTYDGDGRRANGGAIGRDMNGSGLYKYINTLGNSHTFQIYTASGPYNRLHYLEESMANMIYELANANTENRVTLVGFTKTIMTWTDENGNQISEGPYDLTPANTAMLAGAVTSINTGGGTRQDLGLQQAFNGHLNVGSQGFDRGKDHTYTILITDGAPVESDDVSLGTPNDGANQSGSIYARIKYWANQVKSKSELMTVGLGMGNVEGGKQVLEEIASTDHYCALDDASQLVKEMQELLFENFRPDGEIEIRGDIVDEISDSFYPIAWTASGAGAATGRRVLVQNGQLDWIQLNPGDWITLDGEYTTAGAANAAGQVQRKEDGTFCITWKNVQLNNTMDADLDRIAWVPKGQGEASGRTVVGSDDTRDWVFLREGDWITPQGQFMTSPPTTNNARYSNGQVTVSGTDYRISWGWWANGNNRQTYTPGIEWDGTFYVKAKEDFIGGNAIDTNKTAYVQVNGAKDYYEKPTVNVRLLDMNEMRSEVTVYLGDLINEQGNAPIDSLQSFFENTKFTKLISNDGNVLNKFDPTYTDGLEAAVFYLRYALGRDLVTGEWNQLQKGEPLTVQYTYDDPSSHGPVGYFTFELEKTGMTGSSPDYGAHEATAACQPDGTPLTEDCEHPAETYTLHVTYTAYELGEHGRPAENVHNGDAGPGTEVGTGSTLPTGLGIIEKENIHEVHVISGKIEVTKVLDEGLTAETDRTFTFTLHRNEDTDSSKDMTGTVTIPAGTSAGSATLTFAPLRRGTYTLTEAADDVYEVKSMTVQTSTNCYSEPPIGETAPQAIFVMGDDPGHANVIGRAAETDAYTAYIAPPKGVYGAAVITNREIVYEGEVPVRKLWDDGTESHADECVYVVLYEENTLVTDEEGRAKLLRLDASNNWQGSFTVVLDDKDDRVENHAYSVREVSQADTAWHIGWEKALLENDGETVMYYEAALEDGELLTSGEHSYVVHYTTHADGTLQVENYQAITLPMTGGHGTHLYQRSGLLLIAAALVYGYMLRRRREGRRDA